MGGVEDNQWFDKFMDEIGMVFTKVDESIQKSIELWTELTRDIFDDQPTQDLTGQPNSGESGEEISSQYPVAEVKERPIQHWSMCLAEVEEKPSQHWAMCLAEVKEKPSQHWAMRASKIPESFIQEQGDDDYFDGDGDGDGDGDAEEEEESKLSEEDSKSSLKWNGDYQLLKSVDTCSEEEEDDNDDDDDDDDDDDEDVDTFSEEDDESWNDDDDDDEDKEEDTTVSKSSEKMSELNLRSYIPSSYHHHNEEDSDSSLKWKGDYQLLKNVDTSSEEEDDDDEFGECHYEDIEEVIEMSRKHRMMSDLSNESLVVHDDEGDVWDKLQGFVDVRKEEIGNNTEFGEVETLFPVSDWVYVTRD